MTAIRYKDEALLAVDKPTRLLTVPGRGVDKQDCLYHRIRERFPDALVVHRLDMDTSGLVLFARSPEAQRALSMQFERREVVKTYTAVVEGVVTADEGIVDYPMRKDMTQRLPPKHLIDCVRGKRAVTRWTVVERGTATTRLRLHPETGRSHQLRLHLQSIGHPIVGDNIYGRPAERLMLHAERLAFRHPADDRPLQLASPVPF